MATEEDKQRQLIIDYQTTFDSDCGRRVFADLRKWSGFDMRIIPHGIPETTAFELGRRDMFLHIVDKINTDPNKRRQEETEMEVEYASEE